MKKRKPIFILYYSSHERHPISTEIYLYIMDWPIMLFYLFIYILINLFIFFICLSNYISIHLSLSIHLFICLIIYLIFFVFLHTGPTNVWLMLWV